MHRRRVVDGLLGTTRKCFQHFSRDPTEVVKSNRREAFEYFWTQDRYIAQCYLEPGRMALYELVAQYCVDILTIADFPRTVRIADIGCGAGQMLELLRRRLVATCHLELFGLDFANSAVIKAKKLLPMATFINEDLYENSLPSDFYDLVLSIETLEHLHRPEDALRELLRICKPAGSIVITIPNGEKDSWDGHVNFWNMAQFREFLSSHRLVEIKLLQNDAVIMARLVK